MPSTRPLPKLCRMSSSIRLMGVFSDIHNAKPRAMISMARVAMNGTTLPQVMARPLIEPRSSAMPSAPSMNIQEPYDSQQPSRDAGRGQHRPHRQVDASGGDHERHADGDDAGDAGLREHVEQVVAGQEDARPDDRPDDDQSNDHDRQHQLLDGHLAQAAPSVDRGCVGVDGHFLTLPSLCDEPGQPTAARPPRCWSHRRARRRCGPHASPVRGGRNRAARRAHWKP